MKYLLILLGGGAGSLARYLAGTAIMTRFGGRFPLGTLVINVTGSFLIGLHHDAAHRAPAARHVLASRCWWSASWAATPRFRVSSGRAYSAIREGGFWIGFANVVGSVTLGYAAVWLGALLARR